MCVLMLVGDDAGAKLNEDQLISSVCMCVCVYARYVRDEMEVAVVGRRRSCCHASLVLHVCASLSSCTYDHVLFISLLADAGAPLVVIGSPVHV